MTLGTESPYISRDDESEAAVVRDYSGVGDMIIDPEQVREYSLSDFGMGLDEETRR